MTQPKVEVSLYDHQKDMSIKPDQVPEIVTQVVANENQTAHEASVYFITDDEMRAMHLTHFNDPSPTDCISFPMDDSNEKHYRVLGEVFVCPKTALLYAKKHQQDPYRELTLYLVHGLLHLMGYDDIEEEDRLKMRQAEARQMELLEKSGYLLRSA